MNRLIRAVIDAGALRHNLRTVRERARGARVMAVVKANAYGHGLVPTALALAESDAFAVARALAAVDGLRAGVRIGSTLDGVTVRGPHVGAGRALDADAGESGFV